MRQLDVLYAKGRILTHCSILANRSMPNFKAHSKEEQVRNVMLAIEKVKHIVLKAYEIPEYADLCAVKDISKDILEGFEEEFQQKYRRHGIDVLWHSSFFTAGEIWITTYCESTMHASMVSELGGELRDFKIEQRVLSCLAGPIISNCITENVKSDAGLRLSSNIYNADTEPNGAPGARVMIEVEYRNRTITQLHKHMKHWMSTLVNLQYGIAFKVNQVDAERNARGDETTVEVKRGLIGDFLDCAAIGIVYQRPEIGRSEFEPRIPICICVYDFGTNVWPKNWTSQLRAFFSFRHVRICRAEFEEDDAEDEIAVHEPSTIPNNCIRLPSQNIFTNLNDTFNGRRNNLTEDQFRPIVIELHRIVKVYIQALRQIMAERGQVQRRMAT